MDFLERNKALFAEIEEKIKNDPQNVENYLLLGKLYVMGKQFDKAIEIEMQIKNKFGLKVMLQRVYYNGIYHIYSDRIEEYFKNHQLDVAEEKANNVDFYGRYCWAGSKFFYIEYNGDVHRCYTSQYGKNDILGNVSKYKNIKINYLPFPCMSKLNGNCVCFKHFVGSKFLTEYDADKKTIKKYKNSGKFKNLIKYNSYRFLSNLTTGKIKQKLNSKKNKYKVKINEK